MTRTPTELGDIRLVVSDIDGTLVRKDKSLAPETINAVHRIQNIGIGFTMISARPPSGLGGLIAELGLEVPAGAFNGATIFRPDSSIVEANHIGGQTSRKIVEVFDRLAVPVWVFADGQWMTRTREMPHVAQEIIAARQEPVVTPDFDRWMERADKVQGVSNDSDLLSRAERELKEAIGDEATVARSQHYYLDATAPRTDKGHGVRELAKAFDVPVERVAVLGDMTNDLPMFRVAGRAVAMGQALDDIKGAADEVTESNENNGVAMFLRKLIAAHR